MSKEPVTSRVDRVIEDVELLFGADSGILEGVRAEYSRYREDIRKIEHAETTSECVVAFMGKRSVGKTTLLKSLFPHEEAVQALPVDAPQSSRLTWVGPEKPLRLDDAVESYIPAEIKQASLSGRSLLFLDTPALGAADARIQKMTREALLSAEVKILIVASDDLAVEQLFVDLGEADGSIIIPVVHLSPGTTSDWDDEKVRQSVKRDVSESMRRWNRYLPQTKLMEPVFIGDSDAKRPIEESINLKLESALASALEDPDCVENSRKGRKKAAEIRYSERALEILRTDLSRIVDSYGAVQQAEARLPSDVIEYLFSNDDALITFLNWQVRRGILREIHPLMVPVRSLWTLVAYTSGAWERLMLGMQGSLLSVLTAGRKSYQNITESIIGDQQFKTDLHGHLSGHLINQITPKYRAFDRDLQAIVGHEAEIGEQDLQVEVSGVDGLTEKWASMVDEATSPRSVQSERLLSFMSFLAFWFLVSGPLIYLYKRHIPAVLESWSATWDGTVQHQFPAYSAGDWLTTVLLSVVPVLLLGGILLSFRCRRKRVQHIAESLKTELTRAQSDEKIFLKVKLKSARMRAVDRLMQALPPFNPNPEIKRG